MMFKFSINIDETRLDSLLHLAIWICSLRRIFLFLAVVLLNYNWQGYFDEIAYFSSKLAMSIANTKYVERRITTDIWSQNILVLVDFVRIVWMVPNPGSKCKLTNTVLTFFVLWLLLCFLLCIVHHWRIPA